MGNVLALLLQLFVFGKVLDVFVLVRVKYFGFLCMTLSTFHKLFDRIELLVHGDTLSHDLVFLDSDIANLVQAILNCDNYRRIRNVTVPGGCWDGCFDLAAGFGNQGKHLLVLLVSLRNLHVHGSGLLHLLSVVLDLLFIGPVNLVGRLDLAQISGLAHLGILLLLFIDALGDSVEDVVVQLKVILICLNRVLKACSAAFLLELLDLVPEGIRNALVRRQTLDRHRQVHLFQEVVALFVRGLLAGKLSRNNRLKHILEFLLHLADLRRYQLLELGINRRWRVDKVLDLKLLHKVLGIGLWALVERQFLVEVNLFVFVHHASGDQLCLAKNFFKVLLVLAAKGVDERQAFLELLHGDLANSDSLAALLGVLIYKLGLGLSE